MLYGTPEQIIKHLNTLICLFQNGYFGKYKEKKSKPPTVDSNNKTLENEQYMNRKPLIRLTESELHRIIKESVNRILKEGYYDFDNDFNADDVECPYCGSNNVEPISAIDTHYRCLDCGEEFYLDGGWEPDWGAMRYESHKRKGKNINEATTPTWKRWQGYTPDQKAERLAYMQQQIAQLKQQREYAKQKAKTARTPEEQQTWRNTKAQIDRELLRVVSHEHDLRVGKKMTQGAKERAAIKRREDRTKAKNRITFQPQDDPYYTNESKNMNKKLIRLTESDLHKIVKESINRILKEDGYSYNGIQIQNDLRNQVETTWDNFQTEREKTANEVINGMGYNACIAALKKYMTKYYGKGYREGDRIDNKVIRRAIEMGYAKDIDDLFLNYR